MAAQFFLVFLVFLNFAWASMEDVVLKKMIGHMLIIGFDEEAVTNQSSIIKEIKQYELGGVILFDRFYKDKKHIKNIRSSEQLQTLTQQLKSTALHPLLVCVDQEGGKVARLKPSYGFIQTPSAFEISHYPMDTVQEIYDAMAKMLSENGINCNFAPVVDLAINPENHVIVGLERSFGDNPIKVSSFASSMLHSFDKHKVFGVLKHFPGHGSSVGDSHLGFVDITNTWNQIELEPFRILIADNKIKMIMSAHVFNATLDSRYPATLSYAVNTTLLRSGLGFKGILVSDDMQMEAIQKYYSLKEAVTLAINSGVDMLLFGNQLSHTEASEIIETIFQQINNGSIKIERIEEANQRIKKALKTK